MGAGTGMGTWCAVGGGGDEPDKLEMSPANQMNRKPIDSASALWVL